MHAAYLYLNGVVCLGFAMASTLFPCPVAGALGITLDTAGARSGFLALYGGLYLGLAAFFTASAVARRRRPAALLLAVCLWPAIAAYRLATVATYPDLGQGTYVIAVVEAILAIGALAIAVQRGVRRRR